MISVFLSKDEIFRAELMAVHSFEDGERRRRASGGPISKVKILRSKLVDFAAELAFCKWKQYPQWQREKTSGPYHQIFRGYNFRTSFYDKSIPGNIIIRTRDNPTDICIAMHQARKGLDKFYICGWLYAGEARNLGEYKELVPGYAPIWLVTAKHLNPIQTLPW